MKNIILFGESILHTFTGPESYKRATAALKQASKTPAAEHLRFSIVGKAGTKDWSLVASAKEIEKMFVRNPDGFVIKVEE